MGFWRVLGCIRDYFYLFENRIKILFIEFFFKNKFVIFYDYNVLKVVKISFNNCKWLFYYKDWWIIFVIFIDMW